ncbi:unnamed protein product [Auanema sp. JU1783]|nr:unnamed protein product [Auanema sp. JU1783]
MKSARKRARLEKRRAEIPKYLSSSLIEKSEEILSATKLKGCTGQNISLSPRGYINYQGSAFESRSE